MKVKNRRLAIVLLVGVMLTTVESCKQEKAPEVRLRGDQFDPVRSLIDETIRKHNIVSVAIAAARDGRIVWEEAFGWADREKQIPATPQSIYALASISKSFTATGLMVLVERGVVDLDRPINAYLGEAKLAIYAMYYHRRLPRNLPSRLSNRIILCAPRVGFVWVDRPIKLANPPQKRLTFSLLNSTLLVVNSRPNRSRDAR